MLLIRDCRIRTRLLLYSINSRSVCEYDRYEDADNTPINLNSANSYQFLIFLKLYGWTQNVMIIGVTSKFGESSSNIF